MEYFPIHMGTLRLTWRLNVVVPRFLENHYSNNFVQRKFYQTLPSAKSLDTLGVMKRVYYFIASHKNYVGN